LLEAQQGLLMALPRVNLPPSLEAALLVFFPLPHAHGSFRPWLPGWPNANFLNSAGGCPVGICAVSSASTGFSSQGASIFIENTSSPVPGLNRTPNHASTLAEYFCSSQCACSFLAASPALSH
jgi:hypothetical protein